MLKKCGLNTGQMRSREVYHNAGWYNCAGNKLGWGDLSTEDIERIKNALDENECLIILREGDSYWEFVEEFGIAGGTHKVNPKEKNPGQDYVLEKMIGIIIKGRHLRVSDWPSDDPDTVDRELGTNIVLDKLFS